MATRNSNYEDLMLRLSNHINGINLILDIVDVNSFPGSSRLEKVIARELVQLRGRINHIPAANVVHDKGVADPKNVSTGSRPDIKKAVSAPLTKAQQDSKKTNGSPMKTSQPNSKKASGPLPTKSQPSKNINVAAAVPASKNAAKAASAVPKHRTPLELGRHILKKMGETVNFQLDTDNHFYCLPCERSMHVNNLLDHITGKGHQKYVAVEESADEEGEYYADNGYDDSDYDPVFEMMEEMNDSSDERTVELMWDIVYSTDNTIDNIKPSGKWFYCCLCDKTLNGPFQVVDHVRSSRHQAE